MGEPSMYERVGGHQFFVDLVEDFYSAVEADAELIAVYPKPHDPIATRERLRLFLEQYWGGPTTYSDTRGHPRLRMRHLPFPVDDNAMLRWLRAMRHALDQRELESTLDEELWAYFAMAAPAMRNIN